MEMELEQMKKTCRFAGYIFFPTGYMFTVNSSEIQTLIAKHARRWVV